MRGKEFSRREIEERLSKMGDYVKIGFLSDCLKATLDFDTRKFALVKLANLYETRKMYFDAGKAMRSAAEINTTFVGKMNDFIKAAELFVRGGDYDLADAAVKNALSHANGEQRNVVKKSVKGFYMNQAREFLANDRRKGATEVYEKLLTMEIDESERQDVSEKLLQLYDNLGKIREYYMLKKQIK